MDKRIDIPLNKNKIILLFIGCAVFIAFGILFINKPLFFTTSIVRNPTIILVSGIAAIFFFGICSVFIIRKIFDNKPGLTIDQFGITDNTNATSVGLIDWEDITSIKKKQIMSNKFLIIYTNKPQKYIQRNKNIISKLAAKSNFKNYGSPITIISNSLKIDFYELEELLISEFNERTKGGNVS